MSYHTRLKLIHGYEARKHPLYDVWYNMKVRCLNKTSKSYENYGGRGIGICREWVDSFESFALCMGLPPTPNHTLDRINNLLGYCPENCKWSTRTEQCLNRRVFKNNTTSETGVVKNENGSFNSRFDFENKRYNLGNFNTLEEAVTRRREFLILFENNKKLAIKTISKKARRDSATGILGISKSKDGFLVRVTDKFKVRKYLGFSKTLEGAVKILNGHGDVDDKG